MKTEDLEKFKKLCEENGFTVMDGGIIPRDSILVEVSKKDIWDGVEFIEDKVSGRFFKISNSIDWCDENKKFYNPSTEQAYTEQLKKESFERFVDIKEGDRFDTSVINKNWNKDSFIKGNLFRYDKETDRLYVGSDVCKVCIYEKGKWAVKLPEKVEVGFYWNRSNDDDRVYFHFYKHTGEDHEFGEPLLFEDDQTKIKKVGDFLAKQLEEHLNKKP